MRKEEFSDDYFSWSNAEEAHSLKWWIIWRLDWESMNADEIYGESGCSDIAMYLALHFLVEEGIIRGPSPYCETCPIDHRLMEYSIVRNPKTKVFIKAAVELGLKWSSSEFELL